MQLFIFHNTRNSYEKIPTHSMDCCVRLSSSQQPSTISFFASHPHSHHAKRNETKISKPPPSHSIRIRVFWSQRRIVSVLMLHWRSTILFLLWFGCPRIIFWTHFRPSQIGSKHQRFQMYCRVFLQCSFDGDQNGKHNQHKIHNAHTMGSSTCLCTNVRYAV